MNKNLIIIFIICLSFKLSANDGYYDERPNSGSPFNSENKDIVMLSEKVVYKDNWFTTRFKFKNTANNTVKVKLGFPIRGGYNQGITTRKVSSQLFKNYFKFKTLVNGKEIKRDLKIIKHKNSYEYIYIAELTFKPNEVVIVENKYFQEALKAGSAGIYDYREIGYIAVTGKSWKKKIGSAEFIFYLPKREKKYSCNDNTGNSSFFSAYPHPHQETSNKRYHVLKYKFKNIDPDFNFKISWGCFLNNPEKKITDYNIYTNINKYLYDEKYKKEKLSRFISKNSGNVNSWFLYRFWTENIIKLKFFSKNTRYRNKYSDIPNRFLINSVLAFQGYKIDEPLYDKFFKKFKWYKPSKKIINRKSVLIKLGLLEYFEGNK